MYYIIICIIEYSLQCTTTCGTGQQTRDVWCPTTGLCDPLHKPSLVKQCSQQPCLSWVAGSWSQVCYYKSSCQQELITTKFVCSAAHFARYLTDLFNK